MKQLALEPAGWSFASIVAVLAVALVASIGTVMTTASGELLLAWSVLWVVGAGYAGYRFRTWFWPFQNAITMIALAMLWEVVYGQTSWMSMYVFMIAVVYAVAASMGALIGTWLGIRRQQSVAAS